MTGNAIRDYVREFEPEIQKIFYDVYGENLESIPEELFDLEYPTENVLERLLKMRNVRNQKVILMRYGVVTGTPVGLDEIANVFEITRERVRQIESMFRKGLWRTARSARCWSDYLD